MLRTITLGTSVTIQGMFVRDYPDGEIAVRDGNTIYTGKPVKTAA